MKYLLGLLLVFCFASQNNVKGPPQIKKKIQRQYTSKTIYKTNELKKDELEYHFETGFDRAGNPMYTINHLASKKDTIKQFTNQVTKKLGKKICYYNDKSEPVFCKQKQKNAVLLFFPPDLKKPVSYELHDKNGIIGIISWYGHEKYPYKKAFATERRFDKYGNLIYSVSTEYYLPLDFDPQLKRSRKISKKGLVQAGKSKIYEVEYEYYE